MTAADTAAPMAPGFGARLAEAVLTRHSPRRMPLVQWATSATVYAASALVMALGVVAGVVPGRALAGWCVFVAAGVGGSTCCCAAATASAGATRR